MSAGPATAAGVADLRVGATIFDPQGGIVGTIESVSPQGVVLSTGTARARVAPGSIAKNARGLFVAVTRAELEARISAQATPPAPVAPPAAVATPAPATAPPETAPPSPGSDTAPAPTPGPETSAPEPSTQAESPPTETETATDPPDTPD